MITNSPSDEESSLVGAIGARHGATPLECIYYCSPMVVDTDDESFLPFFKASWSGTK